MHVLIEIQPLNLSSGAREAVRVASAQDRRITGLNGVVWAPAITVKPVLGIRLFDGDFSSTVEPGAATFTINLAEVAETYPNTYAYLWAGAPVSIYAETPGTAWPWTRRFVGKVSRFEKTAKRLQLVAEVDSAALDKDVLYLKYAGTTGLEGGADLKDRVRPWVWGHVKSIEPIQIDIDNSVFQVSGYGPIGNITAVYERGSSFGASQSDYPNYAALVAATIPPGKWATCLAQGLFRLGAPPFGVITADVQGHLVAGAVPRRTGAIIKAMATALSISALSIDAASLDALDAAVPRNINVYLTEQTSFIDFAQQLCLPCNAYSGMSWTGQFFAVRPVFGSASLTLNGQGRADPPVLEMIEGGVNPPFKKTIMGADRCWRVHTTTEIAYQDILVDRGRYSATETYRAGNIVDLADGSRWLYINTTAAAGNAPVEGAFWTQISDQVEPVYLDGTPMRDLQPAEPGATEGAIVPVPGSGQPGNIKDGDGNYRDPGELLNSEIELTAAGRLQYRPLPDVEPVQLGQIRLPDLNAVSQDAFRRAEDDIDQVATALAVALDEASRTRATFTDAGFYVDPATGQVRIHAIEQTKERVGTAEIRLNAAESSILLRATNSYVNEQIALAVIDPSQIAELTDIFLRIGAAEIDIDGLNATVTTLATVTELILVEGRVTNAEEEIDALEGTITTKVDTTTFDALATRVTNAETVLTAIGDTASIVNSVSAVRLVEKAQDANAEQDLRALLLGDRTKREQVAAIAAARQELTARIIDGDTAEAAFRLALQVRVGAAEASIATESLIRATQNSALASQIFNLGVSLENEVGTLQANIDEVQQAIVDEEGARSLAISEVNASITDLATALSDEEQARVDAINSATDTLIGQIEAEAAARGEALTAEEEARIAALEAEREQTLEDIAAEREAREGAIATIDARVEEVEQASVDRDGEILAGISREASVSRGSRTELDKLVDKVLGGLLYTDKASRQTGQQLGFVREEITALLSSEISGVVSRVVGLALRIGEVKGSIRELDRVVIENNSTLVQSIDSLSLNVTTTRTDLETSISTTRTDLEGEISTTRGDLEGDISSAVGRVDNLEGDLADEVGARAAGDAAEAEARTIEISGAITSERLLWQEGDSIIAGTVETVSSRVDDAEASITSFAESIDGLEARQGVRLDVNGRVTGYVQNNDGEQGNFTIVADNFEVVDPDTGEVYLGADEDGLRLQNGKVVMDNGVNMLVMGAGFGVDSQFVMWFGPSQPIEDCNEADALFFLDVTGDGEYGLRLGSNFYKNSGTGTSLASNAQIIVGPFVTDGGSKQVSIGFTYFHTVRITDAFAYSGAVQAVVRVERSVNGGTWATVGDYTFNGTATGSDGFGEAEPGTATIQISQAASFTDTTAGTGTFAYRATIISRSVDGLTSTILPGGDSLSQVVTLISTEQIT